MLEALTESFCERCGTRYEFKAPTRLSPLRRTRGFMGGLKNYLTSQDDFSDAMADAMRGEEGGLAAAQLEAFHESFSFCIGCRQYTCRTCWNDGAGRCRSCAPIAGTDDLIERMEASFTGAAAVAAGPVRGAPEHDLPGPLGAEAWPTADLTVGSAAEARAVNSDAPVWPPDEELTPAAVMAEPDIEAEPVADPPPEPVVAEIEPEPVVAAEVEAKAEIEPVAEIEPEPEPEPVAAVTDGDSPELSVPPLRVLSWDEDAADDVAPEPAEVEPEPAAAEVEPEPVAAEAELEPAAAEAEPEPEPVTAEVVGVESEVGPPAAGVIRPSSETILPMRPRPSAAPEPDERVAAVADEPEVAARRAQLDHLGLGDPGQEPVAPAQRTVLPYRSRGAAAGPAEVAARSSFWEASAREVAEAGSHVGVQNCGQCGLSLSTSARFCRRCGTPQARTA